MTDNEIEFIPTSFTLILLPFEHSLWEDLTFVTTTLTTIIRIMSPRNAVSMIDSPYHFVWIWYRFCNVVQNESQQLRYIYHKTFPPLASKTSEITQALRKKNDAKGGVRWLCWGGVRVEWGVVSLWGHLPIIIIRIIINLIPISTSLLPVLSPRPHH